MSPAKVVSVSLFGNKEKYLRGADKLTDSIQKTLPEWKIVFFVGNSVPQRIKESLESRNATLVMVDEPENLSATAWRFRVGELGNPDWVIFRDSDSIVSSREARAITQWVESGRVAHIIRDHPFHSSKILAGLWGLRPKEAEWFAREVRDFDFLDTYGSDQDFLADRIYPKISKTSLVHASFHRHEHPSQLADFTIGSSRIGPFCGESITENLIVRSYARLRRLFAKKACKCKT